MVHETGSKSAKERKRITEKMERETNISVTNYLTISPSQKIFNKTTTTTIQNTTTTTTSRSFMMIAVMKRLTDDCFRPVHPAVRRGLLFKRVNLRNRPIGGPGLRIRALRWRFIKKKKEKTHIPAREGRIPEAPARAPRTCTIILNLNEKGNETKKKHTQAR